MKTLNLIFAVLIWSTLFSNYLSMKQFFQPVCQMPEFNFANLCAEISKSETYRDKYSILETESNNGGCKDYDIYLPSDVYVTEVNTVSARGCPTEPKLFLTDGLYEYSAAVYRQYGSDGLELITEVSHLKSLGYKEGYQTRSLKMSFKKVSVVKMLENRFVRLCEEILTILKFRNYSINTQGDLMDRMERQKFKIFQFDANGRPIVDRVKARGCPTNPQLFLSDGPQKYSIFFYHSVKGGLLRLDIVKNLRNLGFRAFMRVETSSISHLDSIYMMHPYRFTLLCDEILDLSEFQTYSRDLQAYYEEVREYNVYLPPAYRIGARECPTRPKMFLSEGPVRHSLFVHVPMDFGLVRIDKVNKLSVSLSEDYLLSTSSEEDSEILEEDHGVTLEGNSETARMDSKSALEIRETLFYKLCRDIVDFPGFSSDYAIKFNVRSEVYMEWDVYSSDEISVIGRTAVRLCPSEPKLFLSKGTNKYSVRIYRKASKGLVQVSEAKNLSVLGFKKPKTKPKTSTIG